MHIVLHIERLVLNGISVGPGDRRALEQALTGELSQLLMSGGLSPALLGGGALPSIRAGSIALDPIPSGNRLGAQVAHAVHTGIGA
jgi:hypothetical protein